MEEITQSRRVEMEKMEDEKMEKWKNVAPGEGVEIMPNNNGRQFEASDSFFVGTVVEGLLKSRYRSFFIAIVVIGILTDGANSALAQTEASNMDSELPEVLQNYMEQAARNHPELKADYANYRATLQQVPQVDALPDPELAFGWFIQPIETRVGPQEGRVGITQMFPWFGTLDARGDAASFQAKAALQEFQNTRNRIFYQVQKAWYRMYELDRRQALLEEQRSILKSFEALALQQYETDSGSQVDVLRAQNRIDELEVRIADVKDRKRVALQNFRELLHDSQLNSVEVPDSIAHSAWHGLPDEQKLNDRLASQNPKLLKLDRKRSSARAQRKAADKAGKPSFGLGIDYIFTGKRTDVSGLSDNGKDAMMARAMISIPLNRSKYNAKEKQARLQEDAVRHRENAVADKLYTELQNELARYRESDRTMNLYAEKLIPRTRQAVSIEKSRYSSDGVRFEELLDLQQQLLNQQIQYEEALAKKLTARAYVDYLTGKHSSSEKEKSREGDK